MKNLMKKIRKNNKGFTLVELIIVIAIIAIMTAVAAPQYLKWVDKSRWATDQDNAQIFLTSIQVAVADPDVTVADGTYTFTSAGISVTPTAPDTSLDTLAEHLYEAGWTSATTPVVTNQHQAEPAATSTTFTVTVAGNSVTGAWGA